MISAFLNTVKIPELRRRILFTLAIIVIVRLGAAITTPGVNQAVLSEWFRSTADKAGGVAALFNLFSGGALENCAIFSLGIMPYISASIMLQLLTAVIPRLGRLAREAGASQVNPAILVLMVAFLFVVIAAVITITQGVRKISVQYAKRVVGRKMYGGQTTYMPLKVNYAGVMPIIFAWALLLFPTTIVGFAFKNSPTAAKIASALSNGWPHYVVLAGMIFFFSYFWVVTQFQPSQIADDLKK